MGGQPPNIERQNIRGNFENIQGKFEQGPEAGALDPPNLAGRCPGLWAVDPPNWRVSAPSLWAVSPPTDRVILNILLSIKTALAEVVA